MEEAEKEERQEISESMEKLILEEDMEINEEIEEQIEEEDLFGRPGTDDSMVGGDIPIDLKRIKGKICKNILIYF
ncbi:unnamed protein product [Meloidogyne enterolobii]|uniref:Uncharacterized protein n=1 Tax=Meloidogyne enterolobii TaxID=390850 RepID=A0ACB1AIW1_MELEN